MTTAKNREPDVLVSSGKQRENTPLPVFPGTVPGSGTTADSAEDLHSRYSRHVEKLDRFLAEATPPRRRRKIT